ncbi:MAG: ImmA/IrrE family metallo-endopeptidase [bacterium]
MRQKKAVVEPHLLVWARETTGFSIEEAAKKVKVKPERLQLWERGELQPTINQLRKLGDVYKRPLAIFYLPKPPVESFAIHDFRRFPGEAAGYQSPKLRLAVRQAQFRREVALDLYRGTEGVPPDFPFRFALSDAPEKVAREIREFLGVTYEEQINWNGLYKAFNRWRSALEDVGILVFQVSGVDVEEIRGLSISEMPLPTVVVNNRDSVPGRIFSMLHELTHLVLNEGGMCDMREGAYEAQEARHIEVFCNRVAGEILVPTQYLLAEEQVLGNQGKERWTDEDLRFLANRYRVSREMLLRRLLICSRTSDSFYREKRQQFNLEYEASAKRRESGRGPQPHRRPLISAGYFFVRLVLNSYYQDRITPNDVAEFLDVRLKHLRNIEHEVFGKPS